MLMIYVYIMSQESLNPTEHQQPMLLTDIEALLSSHIDELAVTQDYSNLADPTVLVLGGKWRRDQYNLLTPVSIRRELGPTKDPDEVMTIKIGEGVYQLPREQSSNIKKPVVEEEWREIRSILTSADVTWSRDMSEALAAKP